MSDEKATTKKIQIRMAGDWPHLAFVEVETQDGKSISIGEWSRDERADHLLTFDDPRLVAEQQATIEQLAIERDAALAINESNRDGVELASNCLDAGGERIGELEAQLKAAREALVNYGAHDEGCGAMPEWDTDVVLASDSKCDCGLRAALAEMDDVEILSQEELKEGK